MENTDSNKALLQQADAFNKKVNTQTKRKKKERFTIPASTLKWIAMLTMLLQNINLVIIDRKMDVENIGKAATNTIWKFQDRFDPGWRLQANKIYMDGINDFFAKNSNTYTFYLIITVIGCIALPLLCFLLVEGYLKSERKRYAVMELGVVAMLSEIPFDLAMSGKVYDYMSQNLFFGLFIGTVTVALIDMSWKRFIDSKALKYLLTVVIALAGMAFGIFGMSYYLCFPVLMMVCMYIFHDKKLFSSAIGCFSLTYLSYYYICSFLALIPIHLYNGKPGRKMGYVLFIFYPLHLLILYFIAKGMGLY